MTHTPPPPPTGYYPAPTPVPAGAPAGPTPHVIPSGVNEANSHVIPSAVSEANGVEGSPATPADPRPAPARPGAVPYPQPAPSPGAAPYPQPGAVPYPQPGAVPYPQPGTVPYPHSGAAPYPQPGAVPYPQPAPPPITGGPHWLLAVAGALGVFVGSSVIVTIVALIVANLAGLTLEQVENPTSLATQATAALIGALWYRHLRRVNATRPIVFGTTLYQLDQANPRATLPRDRRRLVRMVVCCLALGVIMQVMISAALTIIQTLAPSALADYEEHMEQIVGTGILNQISLVIMAPLSEELFFRGASLELGRRASLRPWVCLVAQATIFGIAHLNLVQGLYAGCLGILFGLIALRGGGLAASMAVHFALNFSSNFVSALLWPFLQLDVAGLVLAVVLTAPATYVLIRLILNLPALPAKLRKPHQQA